MGKKFKWVNLSLAYLVMWLNMVRETKCLVSSTLPTGTAEPKTGSCPSENVGTVDALGVFTWPESRAERLVRLPCPHNRSVYATRECQNIDDGEISWGPIDSKACPYRNKWSQEIFDLSKKRINSSNVVPVSERIRNLSFPGTKLIPDDIVHTATILENIVAVKEKSDQVADDFLGTVDNILDAPLGVVMMSQRRENSSLRIVGSLNTFLEKLNVIKEQPFRRTLRNYAVYLQMVDPRSFSGITFSGVIKSEISTQLRDGGIETKLTDVVTSLNATTIRLPRTLFNDTTVALSQSQTIVFALYKETKFFRLMSHGSMRSPQRLNSYIIAGGIKGLTISNLRNPIVLTYPNLKPGDKNDTVCGFWNFVGANWSTDGCLFQGLLKDGRIVCNCNHLTNFGILMDIFIEESEPRTETDNEVLSLISYVGCGLSLTGLMMTIFTILLFKDLRSKLPSQILLNFCIALSLTLIVFLAAAERSKTPSMAFCRAAAIALHYFVLAAFMWMGMEAFNMYLAFVHILPSYFPNFLLKCCIVAWGIPAVLVSITAGVALDQYGDTTYCRLRGVPFLVSYLSPTLLILVANSIAFALIMRSLLTSGNKATDNQKATGLQQARRGAAIMVLLGLTWMFGVLAIKDAKPVFQYLFCIFNSLQGLLVFVFYVVLPDGTRKMYAKFWQRNAGNPKTKREVWSSGTGIPKKADNDKYKEAYGDNIMSISSPHADTLSDNSTNVADSFRNCMVQLMEQQENGNVKEGTVTDNACKTSGTVILNGLNPGR